MQPETIMELLEAKKPIGAVPVDSRRSLNGTLFEPLIIRRVDEIAELRTALKL